MASLDSLFCVLALLGATGLLIPSTCLAKLVEKKHAALFIFGDSLFDAGNNVFINGPTADFLISWKKLCICKSYFNLSLVMLLDCDFLWYVVVCSWVCKIAVDQTISTAGVWGIYRWGELCISWRRCSSWNSSRSRMWSSAKLDFAILHRLAYFRIWKNIWFSLA